MATLCERQAPIQPVLTKSFYLNYSQLDAGSAYRHEAIDCWRWTGSLNSKTLYIVILIFTDLRYHRFGSAQTSGRRLHDAFLPFCGLIRQKIRRLLQMAFAGER